MANKGSQFRKGPGEPEFEELYGREEKRREQYVGRRWSSGFKCPRPRYVGAGNPGYTARHGKLRIKRPLSPVYAQLLTTAGIKTAERVHQCFYASREEHLTGRFPVSAAI